MALFRYFPQILFGFSVIFLAVLYGMVSYRYNLFPAPIVRDGFSYLSAVSPFSGSRPHYIYPLKYDKVGVLVHEPEKVSPGVTMISSAWSDHDWLNGIRVIDQQGNVLHKWDINPVTIYPESPHDDLAKGSKNFAENYIHGAYLFPNGDLLFNIEYLGLVRMDSCGEILWKLPYRTHHSISRNEDGNFWVSGQTWVTEGDERKSLFPGLETPFVEETAVLVSPAGEILKEISLLESIYDAGAEDQFWKTRHYSGDVTHLNDVEELSTELAGVFPSFDAGDLVVSMKHMSAVFVLNQEGEMKWIKDDDMLLQHDPDFEPDGRIVIFDNRADTDSTLKGRYLGGSRMIAVEPASGVTEVIYPRRNDQFFYTSTGGKHQLLDNGNRLITEAIAGRVFEIDRQGNTVWEWFHEPYDEGLVAEVLEGSRYPYSEADVAGWACSKSG